MNRITASLIDKTVFITGATGFLGQPLVEKILLSAPDIRRVYLLIRPRRQLGGRVMNAEERLRREIFQSSVLDRLYSIYGENTEAFLMEKVAAVSGDISAKELGLEHETKARLEAEVDVVINSAAVVSFDAPLDAALKINVLSAARVAEFAQAARAVLVHVSTAYVSGAMSGSVPETVCYMAPAGGNDDPFPVRRFTNFEQDVAHIREIIARVQNKAYSGAVERQLVEALFKRFRRSGRGGKKSRRREKIENLRRKWIQNQLSEEGMAWARRRGWNDTYTYTKAMGEQAVLQKRGDVPTVIIRPSVIESSLLEPTPGWLDGLRMADPLIVAIAKGRLKSLPLDADVTLDLIPVDMVVNTMLAATARAMKEEGVVAYHIATGAKNPVSLGELYNLIYEYFRRNPMLNKQGNPIRIKRLKFPKPSTFRLQHKLKTVPLGTVERTLEQLPLPSVSEKFKRKISAARAAYDRLYYYGEIYQPYLNLDSRFEVDRTIELYESLNEEERRLFNFDITRLNWRHYIQNVHIPGVKKHILKKEGSGTLEVASAASAGALTLNDLVAQSAAQYPDKTALQAKRDGQWRRFTYSDIKRLSDKIGRRLSGMALRKGDRVVLYSENQPEWGTTFLGATSIGLVVVPLDAQTWHREVWAIARFTKAQALLVSEQCFKRLAPDGLQENEHAEKPMTLLNVNQLCSPFGIAEYPRSTQAPASGETGPVAVGPDDLASIIFTTSAAVDPKGVMHTHQSFINNLLGVNRHLPVAESDQLLSVLPLYHALEFTCGFLMPLYGGATVTYAHSLKPKVILETMRETGTTCMLGVPTLYALIRDDVERRVLRATKSALKSNLVTKSKQLSRSVERAFGKNIGRRLFARVHREFGGRIRLFVSGGSSLGEDLYEDFRGFGMPVYEGYGLTETAPVLTVNPLKRSRSGSAGKPLPGVELGIFNADRNGVGEIAVKTPSLMRGYYNNPAATEQVLRHGWFHTGDTGWVDTDGYLYITGRVKDVIVTGAGKNVHPADLEAIYQDVPGIEEICVLGIKSGLTEDVHAIVTASTGRLAVPEVDARKAIQRGIQKVAKELPSYHRLQQIHIQSEALPRRESGEIDRDAVRQKLLQRFHQRRPRAEATNLRSGTKADAAEELFGELSRLSGVPEPDINGDSHLYSDLGLDSLMAIELLLLVEQRFSVSIPDETAARLETAGELLREVQSRAARDCRHDEDAGPRKLHSALPHAQRRAPERYLQKLSCAALKALYGAYFDLKLQNAEHVPRQGRYIIAANHASHLDTGAMISALGTIRGLKEAVRLHVVGARDYFFATPWRGWFFSTFLNVVPVERKEASLAGLRAVRSILNAGEPVLIFPEGTRSRTGQIQEFKAGLGLIALELETPIVPAHIDGTYEAMPPGRLFPRPRQVRVAFGPPLKMRRYRANVAAAPRDELYRQIVADVRETIVELRSTSRRQGG